MRTSDKETVTGWLCQRLLHEFKAENNLYLKCTPVVSSLENLAQVTASLRSSLGAKTKTSFNQFLDDQVSQVSPRQIPGSKM